MSYFLFAHEIERTWLENLHVTHVNVRTYSTNTHSIHSIAMEMENIAENQNQNMLSKFIGVYYNALKLSSNAIVAVSVWPSWKQPVSITTTGKPTEIYVYRVATVIGKFGTHQCAIRRQCWNLRSERYFTMHEHDLHMDIWQALFPVWCIFNTCFPFFFRFHHSLWIILWHCQSHAIIVTYISHI